MSPQRIQRRRTKGWRMPDAATYVGRPTKWGNPFDVGGLMTLDDSLALYRNLVTGIWSPKIPNERGWPDHYVAAIYARQHEWTKRINDHPLHAIRAELAGLHLACWCPLDQPCHADVLLDIANGGQS